MPEYSESPLIPKSSTQRSFPSIVVAAVLGLVLFLLALAGYAFLSEGNVPVEPEPPFIEEGTGQIPDTVACTMDAFICPDGSAVGRSGPNCEFDPCPGV